MNKIAHFAPDSFVIKSIANGTGSDYAAKSVFPWGDGFVLLLNALADGGTDGVGYVNIVAEIDATTTDIWAHGEPLFWDATAAKLTDDPNGNKYIGDARGAKANGDTTAYVFIPDPRQNGRRDIEHLTTGTLALSRHDSGKVVTNLGAGAAVTATLPQDAVGGEEFTFLVMAAQELRIAPGAAGAIYYDIGGTYAKQTDNKYATANALGERITVIADGNGDWIARDQAGTWTEEA